MKIIHKSRRVGRCQDLLGRNEIIICIDITYQQERSRINSLPFTHFIDGKFPETEAYAHSRQDIEKLIISSDKVRQLHRPRENNFLITCHTSSGNTPCNEKEVFRRGRPLFNTTIKRICFSITIMAYFPSPFREIF